jgi:hypothetical protein
MGLDRVAVLTRDQESHTRPSLLGGGSFRLFQGSEPIVASVDDSKNRSRKNMRVYLG